MLFLLLQLFNLISYTTFPEELNAITAGLNSLSPELLSRIAAIVAVLSR
jgi:hypothetical protein